uniref:Actin maturation protease n=1 Tax=Bos mutus grunniens TaxID=30521 RepID=A0A8B9XQ18_BOSMU
MFSSFRATSSSSRNPASQALSIPLPPLPLNLPELAFPPSSFQASVPPPPPLPPPPRTTGFAPPHVFGLEKSQLLKEALERAGPAPGSREDVKRLLKLHKDRFRSDLQWILFCADLPSLIQEGPQCGLVALWMAGTLLAPPGGTPLERLVQVAMERGYTAQGDVLSGRHGQAGPGGTGLPGRGALRRPGRSQQRPRPAAHCRRTPPPYPLRRGLQPRTMSEEGPQGPLGCECRGPAGCAACAQPWLLGGSRAARPVPPSPRHTPPATIPAGRRLPRGCLPPRQAGQELAPPAVGLRPSPGQQPAADGLLALSGCGWPSTWCLPAGAGRPLWPGPAPPTTGLQPLGCCGPSSAVSPATECPGFSL